jgi:subfamily B ATP-binding cassette protein MsbA
MTGTRLYLRLLGYVRPHWRMFGISIVGMLIVAATEVVLPAAAQPFLDGTFVHKDPVLMRWAPWLIVLLFAVRGVGSFLGQYASNWVSLRVIMDLRQQMFARLLTLPLGYFADNLSGKLISKFTFDVIQIAVAVTYVVTVLVRDSVTIAALLAYLLWLNWKLTLITFVMIPPIAIVVRLFNRRLRGLTRQTQQAMGDVNHVLQESMDNQKVVKIFGGQVYEVRRFADAVNHVRRLLVRSKPPPPPMSRSSSCWQRSR